jgi:hypothetical protein
MAQLKNNVNDPSVMIINVEDYPDIDPDTEEGKEQLGGIGFWAASQHPNKWHFLFFRKGEQIGQMVVRRVFEEKDGKIVAATRQ